MENISSLRIVGFSVPPFIRLVRSGTIIDFTGLGPEVLKYALRASNISYTFMESPDSRHGKELSPGNPTGTMKVLHENEADLSLNHFSITQLRMKYMDLSTPLYYATFTTLSGSPRGVIEYTSTLLDIFHYQVWILLVIAMLLLCGTIHILSHFDHQKRNNWIYYLLIFFGSLTGQEIPHRIYSGYKARAVLFIFWMIGSSCLSSAFMAILLSFLTIREKPNRIDSVEDIVKYPNVKPLILLDSIDTLTIKSSRYPKLVQLWEQIRRHKGEVIYKEMFSPDSLKKTSRGSSVVLGEISYLRSSLRMACVPGSQFHIAENPYFHAAIAHGMRRGLPYAFKHSLTKTLSLFATTHQLQHFVLRASIGATKCLDSAETREKDVEKPLSFKNLKYAFWCLFFGIIFSFLVLIYELLFYLLINKYTS